MNENILPPITVNQAISDSSKETTPPLIPNELGNQHSVATAEFDDLTTETDQLNNLGNNLTEPQPQIDNSLVVDPIPVTPNSATIPTTPAPTVELNNSIPTNSATSKNKSSLIIILLTLVIAVLLIISGLLFYQNSLLKNQITQAKSNQTIELPKTATDPTLKATPAIEDIADPTADWETYSNEIYQIKYPKDIKLKQAENSISLTKMGPSQKEDTEFYDGISLSFTVLPLGELTLEEYVDKQLKEGMELFDVIEGKKEASINNIPGFGYAVQGLGIHKYLLVQRSDQVIIIGDNTQDPADQGFAKTVDEILKTFQLISL